MAFLFLFFYIGSRINFIQEEMYIVGREKNMLYATISELI